jgi:hypothetical protein
VDRALAAAIWMFVSRFSISSPMMQVAVIAGVLGNKGIKEDGVSARWRSLCAARKAILAANDVGDCGSYLRSWCWAYPRWQYVGILS